MLNRFINEKTLRIAVGLSLVSQILIVVTGGAVRLTASGLGCPTWPTCTHESLVTVPAMGIHGIIEFTNRLLTFALLVIAGVTALLAFRLEQAKKIRLSSVLLIVGILLQAVIGGISVLTKLNPWVVGLHFVVSAAMIAIAARQYWQLGQHQTLSVSSSLLATSNMLIVLGFLAELLGVIVTGSGPHAGDINTPRNGLDSELWQKMHSIPGYLTVITCTVLIVSLTRFAKQTMAFRYLLGLGISLVLQIALGIWQANAGLPVWMVLMHMALASVVCAQLVLQRSALAPKSNA